MGFDGMKPCVQAKSSQYAAHVAVLHGLQGSMSMFKTDQGLLASWNGFNIAAEKEARFAQELRSFSRRSKERSAPKAHLGSYTAITSSNESGPMQDGLEPSYSLGDAGTYNWLISLS